MSWNGQVPTNASWQGNPQFAGDEVLYTTPDPATTATNPSIGIVDGNVIPLPTAYNTFNVATLGATTLNSTTINNSGTITTATLGATTGNITTLNSTTINNSGTITTDNINTNTINGGPADASLWSTFDAIHDVVGRGAAVAAYVPRQLYGTGLGLPNLASFGSPYQNYTALQTGGTINPGNTLDAWNSSTLYNPGPILPIFGATYNDIQYLAVTIHDNSPPPSANWRLANYDNAYAYGVGDLAYVPTTKIWYERTTAGSGNPPPNASFWSVYTFWGIYNNDLFPTFDIRGFANVNCGTVNNVTTNSELDVNTATANTETTNATSTINIGTETSGGTLNVGADMVSPTAYPDVNIGNSTISRCSVNIFGDNNVAGSSAVTITGGLTVDAGKGFETDPLTNHGIKMTCDTVGGIGLVRLNMDSVNGISLVTANPVELLQNISLDALTNIKMKSGLGTYVETFDGLYVTGLTDFNDGRIFTNRINPPYAGATAPYNDAILLIDGRTALLDDTIRTGVQIEDGTDWTTQNLNVTNILAPAILGITSTDGMIITGGTGISVVATSGNISASSAAEINLTAVTNINVDTDATIDVTAVVDINLTSTGETNIQSGGSLVLNSSTADASLFANTDIDITSTTSYVGITSGTDISLNPTGVVNLNNKNVTQANTITGNTTLTLASTGTDSIRLYPASGFIECNRPILMGGASGIFQVPTISANASLSLETGGGANNQPINANMNNLQNVNGLSVSSLNGIGLANITVNTNIVSNSRIETSNVVKTPLLQVGRITTNVFGNPVEINTNLDFMSLASIVNLLQINGRNLFSYGNFYNDANQTLTATNTATRVNMNTSLNNNLITLDTTTNIGRLTFTNAGVYHVVWNAYLLHGSGGTTKSVIWIRLNGTDVAGSGKTENNDSQLNETNLTSSSLVSVTAGQYIEFYWAADGTNVPLTAVAASSPYPATPSFSCSISIVG